MDISAIGISGKEAVAVPWDKAVFKVIDIMFNMSSSYTSWDRALSLINNTQMDLTDIITHKTTIENWENTFNDLQEEKGIKALFIM